MSKAIAPTPTLSKLMEYEKVIESGLDTAVDVVWTLSEIRRQELFTAVGYTTFEGYCKGRWGDRWTKLVTPEFRSEVHHELRKEGNSYQAIADTTGASKATVYRDLNELHTLSELRSGVSDETPDLPEKVHGADGKFYPAKRESAPPTKPDLGEGLSHPARYTDALVPVFSTLLDGYDRVLDPFAGTGQRLTPLLAMHDLVGTEIEPEWAALSDWVQEGNALDLDFADESFDAICTSPTYGNRLADHHNASDPHARRSYTHDLGHALNENNSGAMQWGDEYRDFHMTAWSEAVRVLRCGGRFVLNIKDHVRGGQVQPVSAWHLWALGRLGLELNMSVSREVATPSMRAGENGDARTAGEWVFVLEKP